MATVVTPAETRLRLDRYSGFLQQDPANPNLIGEVAELHLQLGEPLEARRLLEQGLARHPAEPGLRFRLATVGLATGTPEESVALLTGLLAESPNNNVIRYNLGYAFMLARQFAEARDILSQIPENSADAPAAPVLLARALHHLGELDAGTDVMQRYLATHPQHAEAAGVLALLSLDNENVAEAKKWAEITLAADPDNLDGLLTDGALALATQDEEHAMATHQRAVARHPRSGRAWGGLGLTQMLALNLDAAVQDLECAVQYMPNHIGTWHALAWCQLMRNDAAAAERSFEKSLKIDRSFAETHGGLAVIALQRGDRQAAEASVRRALRLDPQSFAGRFAESLLLERAGDTAAARRRFQDIMQTPVGGDGKKLQNILVEAFQKKQSRKPDQISQKKS